MYQMEFDLRLDYERNLKDNLNTVARFAGEQMRQNLEDEGRPLKTAESIRSPLAERSTAQRVLRNP